MRLEKQPLPNLPQGGCHEFAFDAPQKNHPVIDAIDPEFHSNTRIH